MPCEVIHGGGGAVVIMCTRGTTRRKNCAVCKARPATKLCDFPLSGSKAGQTCDRDLCDQCAVVQPTVVLPTFGSLVGDTRDFCPAHDRHAETERKNAPQP